jgi:Spy/CpxP family protein refolding chaperone
MGGYGPGYGMGPGAMGSEDYSALNLSVDQKSKIAQIQREVRSKHWALMGTMMDAQEKLQELYDEDKPDSAALNKQYKVVEDMRRQMVESSVDARNRINGVLTKEQQDKFKQWGRGYGPMMGRY